MRVPRMRFTVRRIMVAAAVVAVLLAVAPFRQRSATYHRKALEHSRLVGVSRENAQVQLAAWPEHPEVRALMEASAAEFERLAVWHADLAEKYRRAASRPWEMMPLDPRPPIHSVPLDERFPREAEALRRIEGGR
jgi:hypothetical protein